MSGIHCRNVLLIPLSNTSPSEEAAQQGLRVGVGEEDGIASKREGSDKVGLVQHAAH